MSETHTRSSDVISTFMHHIAQICVSLFSFPDRTVILSPPQAVKVQPGNPAVFTCLPSVDPKLGSPQIQWRKNDKKLSESYSDKK